MTIFSKNMVHISLMKQIMDQDYNNGLYLNHHLTILKNNSKLEHVYILKVQNHLEKLPETYVKILPKNKNKNHKVMK